MGTTSEKLTYLNETKQELKQKINNLGGEITDETTFREYANQLQTIYDNAPKTDYEEGSDITLSNTLKGKLDFEDGIVGIGDTKQEGTPTPDNPQDIEVVRGKNLAQLEFENGYRNYGTGEIISSNSFCSFIAKVSPNNEYYVSNAHSNLCYLDINKNRIGGIAFSGGGLFNTNNMTNVAYVSVAVENSKKDSVQIEKGSQATPYLPYNTIEVVERGKNYCGFNSVSSTGMGVDYIIDKSEITLNGTTNRGGYIYTSTTNFITIPKGTYKLSGYILGGSYNYVGDIEIALKKASDNTKVLTLYKTHYDNQATITLTEDTDLYYGIYTNGSNNVLNNFKIGIQIEAGSTATTYEPYITPITQQLSLGEYEFAKIGNYVDTIEYDVDNDRVYKNEKIGKVVLDGTNIVVTGKSGATANNTFFSQRIADMLEPATNDDVIPLSSNYFIGGTSINYLITHNEYGIAERVGKNLGLGMTLESGINTVELMNTWLSNNQPIVCYPLATPVEIPITDTTLINQVKAWYNAHSNNGTTIIESNGDLPMIIKVRALKGE